MSSNPFLNAINFQPPTQGAQSFDRQSYIDNMLSNMHGVDMSQLPQNTWQPDDSFINAMSNYSKSGASGVPSMPGALSNAQAPQGSGSSSGPSFIDRLKNAVGDAWNQTIGKEYSQAKGGLEGMLTGLLSGVNVHTGQAHAPKNALDPLTGYFNPQGEAQKYQVTKDAMGKGVVPWALGTASDTVTDPLTYAPAGPALKVLGKATGLAKLPSVAQKVAPNLTKKATDFANLLFRSMPGVSKTTKDAYARMINNSNADVVHAGQKLSQMFSGLHPTDQENFMHELEPSALGSSLSNDGYEAIRQQLDPWRQGLQDTAVNHGLVQDLLDPAQHNVGQYVPHVPTSKLDLQNSFSNTGAARSLRQTIDAGNPRTIPGTIKQINDAAGTNKFESNPIKVFLSHAAQISKAVNTKKFIDEVVANGKKIEDGFHEGMIDPDTGEPLVKYTHDNTTVLLPRAESQLLNSLVHGPSNVEKVLGAVKGSANALNKLWFFGTPFYHILANVIPQTLVHDPKAMLSVWKNLPEAFKGVREGSQMDQALKAGALHTSFEAGAHGSIPKRVNEVYDQINGKGLPSAFRRYWMQFTPNAEKAFRTSVFQNSLDRGMNQDEAANFVRSIYGGHEAGQKSAFDSLMSVPMPFWNWTKTANASNMAGMLNRPAPYSLLLHGLDNINQQNSDGKHMWDNSNPLTVDMGTKAPDGREEFWQPSLGPLEPLKLLQALGKDGPITGSMHYGFSRTTPVLKLPIEFGNHTTDPFTSNPYPLDPSPNVPNTPQYAQYHTEPLFGKFGPMVPYQAAQTYQQISNPLGDATWFFDPTKSTTAKWLTNPLFGDGYTSEAPNPASQQKQQAYNNRQATAQMKSWLKRYGGK